MLWEEVIDRKIWATAQQAVCCNAGRMPAESPVGLSNVHTRANIRETPHYSKPPDVVANAKKRHNAEKFIWRD